MISITVAPGDSLWSLAQKHLGNATRWPDIWRLNRETILREQKRRCPRMLIQTCRFASTYVSAQDLPGPDLIYDGLTLLIPANAQAGGEGK